MQEPSKDLTTKSSVPRAWAIPRISMVSLFRTFNTALDTVFYDVKALSLQERAELSAYMKPEGSVIIVYPSESNRRIRTFSPYVLVELQSKENDDPIDTIAVAGVGSSALGTAALARNIADYLGRPVAGIISGFGMSDVLTEALGGWFVLGARNWLRDSLARLFDRYEMKDHVRDSGFHQAMKEHFTSTYIDTERFVYGSPDSATVLYLLSRLSTKIKLVVGHSKGSLSIENALQGWLVACRKTGASINSDLCIVTIGAVIRFPSDFQNVHQFIGRLDYFGIMNSRASVEHILLANAWHSLNSRMLGHLSVQEALQSLNIT